MDNTNKINIESISEIISKLELYNKLLKESKEVDFEEFYQNQIKENTIILNQRVLKIIFPVEKEISLTEGQISFEETIEFINNVEDIEKALETTYLTDSVSKDAYAIMLKVYSRARTVISDRSYRIVSQRNKEEEKEHTHNSFFYYSKYVENIVAEETGRKEESLSCLKYIIDNNPQKYNKEKNIKTLLMKYYKRKCEPRTNEERKNELDFRKSLNNEENIVNDLISIARLQEYFGEFDEAIKTYQDAIENSEYTETKEISKKELEKTIKVKTLIEELETISPEDPKRIRVLDEIVKMSTAMESYKIAEEYLTQIIEKDNGKKSPVDCRNKTEMLYLLKMQEDPKQKDFALELAKDYPNSCYYALKTLKSIIEREGDFKRVKKLEGMLENYTEERNKKVFSINLKKELEDEYFEEIVSDGSYSKIDSLEKLELFLTKVSKDSETDEILVKDVKQTRGRNKEKNASKMKKTSNEEMAERFYLLSNLEKEDGTFVSPSKIKTGKDAFEGYVMFEYEDIDLVVLEEIILKKDMEETEEFDHSSATYIFPSSHSMDIIQDETGSFSKRALIDYVEESDDVVRLNHSKNWEEKINKILTTEDGLSKVKEQQRKAKEYNERYAQKAKVLSSLKNEKMKKKTEVEIYTSLEDLFNALLNPKDKQLKTE